MDEKKLFVDLQPLTDEEIKARNFGLMDLWMVKIAGKDPYGPYDTESLKEYAFKYQFLFEDAKVYNLDTDQWYDMFGISQFQRRKPQLVSAQNLIKSQLFYILYNGQKDGPHSQEKIQQLLDDGHILPSTQVSLDQGQSWIKLYEHHAFDRRTKKSNNELPFRPNEDVLTKVQSKKAQIIKLKEAEDAIVEFAFMGNADGESDLELETNPNLRTQSVFSDAEVASLKKMKKLKKPARAKNEKNYFWKAAPFAFILVAAMGFGLFKFQENKSLDNKTAREARTNKNGIDNSERQIIRKKSRRSPASVPQQVKPKLKPINKMRKMKAPRIIKRRPTKRYVRKPAVKIRETFERDIEQIDLDNPEVQEELDRQLSGEFDEEEELDSEVSNEEEPREEDPYADEEEQDSFNSDERLEHDDY